MNKISIIIPTYNHFAFIGKLAARIHATCTENAIQYEMVFVDDKSTDRTCDYIAQLSNYYPIKLFVKQGKKGKGQSIKEGLRYAKYETVAVLEPDLSYPPEAIAYMLLKLENGADVVVADSETSTRSRLKQSKGIYNFIVSKYIKKIDFDVQSGLKVFSKKIVERIKISSSPRAFDLEFIVACQNAGLRVEKHETEITESIFGKKTGLLPALADYFRCAFAPKVKMAPVPVRSEKLINELGGKHVMFSHKEDDELFEKPPAKRPYKHTAFKITHTVYVTFAIFCVGLFAVWWFNPAHIPENFSGDARYFDILLFLLVSYIIWHPIMMDVLTWAISSHIKDIRQQKPIKGLSVAFITTIVPSSESLDLLHKCLPAMVKADYKHDTWLLDEGNSPEVKAICDTYGVYYFSRKGVDDYNTPSGKFTRTKGGNHNSWYDMYGHAYDIVAQIDTDFVPKKHFLTATLGYFRDPQVAFVGTPQIYGNTKDSIVAKGAAEQLYTFYGSVLRGLSSMGMTLLIGANHVIRTAALKGVDHYSAHITEDLITGMKLHAKGWKSVYLSYPLAIGEGPYSWEAYFSQQMRWAYGCIDIFLRYTPRMFWKMGIRRSIYYFFLQQHYFSGIGMALSILLLSVYFITGIRAADVDLFSFFALYSFVTLISWVMSIWLQHFNVDRKYDGEVHLAGKIISIAAWPVWFLASLCVITGKRISYKVTPKGDAENAAVRESLSAFTPHIIFGLLAVLGIVISFFTGKQSPGMIFWAASSAVMMLCVPFAQEIADALATFKVQTITVIRKIAFFYRRVEKTLTIPPLFAKPFVHNKSMWNKHNQITSKENSDKGKGMLLDSIFLTFIVVLSLILYVNQIGFYSDDWAFLGNFALSQDQSLWGLIQTAITPNTFMRPVQNILDASLYYFFGTNPLGYQIFNAFTLASITVLFYLVLRQLHTPRIAAVAIPLIYALLPHYSTDRFWFAVFQANISMLFYFISLLAALKSVSYKTVWSSHWKILSILALITSGLSYEIAIPLYILNIIILLNPVALMRKIESSDTVQMRNNTIFILLTFFALFYVFIFKLKTSTRITTIDPWYYPELFASAFQVNYGTWIFNLPHILGQTISLYTTPAMMAVGLLLYIVVFWYLLYVSTRPQSNFPSVTWMRNATFVSFGIFILGYSIFLTNNQVGFSPTGIDNRVAIAAALGVALTIVGSIGWISRMLLPEKLAKVAFCMLIALISTGSFLVVNAIATFWIKAHQESKMILADIYNTFPTIPSNSTLILDGVCSYVGPAPVFEAEWDLKGALHLHYKDETIRADVVTPRLKVQKNGLKTQIYTFPAEYPYKKMFIYNYDTKTTHSITDEKAAHAYFSKYNPDFSNGCPVAHAGQGEPIF